MVSNKEPRLEINLIAALLTDVQRHVGVFTPRSLKLTTARLRTRYEREGMGFLTKTLPRLGRAFDKALSGEIPLDSGRWRKLPNSKLPRFLGELFQCIFSHDGWILPTPNVTCIKVLRQILYLYSKYELPYSPEQEQAVLDQFIKNDHELVSYSHSCSKGAACCTTRSRCPTCRSSLLQGQESQGGEEKQERRLRVIERARQLLSTLFACFDPYDIYPRHGPGSVSTKERYQGKYRWSTVSARIREHFPLDAYFYASLGHVCDKVDELQLISDAESSAKVVLVPKDSRGPRLISEEPLEFQWIQQGLRAALYKLVETNPLTRYNVHFTDQRPNQYGALLGSMKERYYFSPSKGQVVPYTLKHGAYSTLDLKEASDRVSIGLVNLLFPQNISDVLMASRSLGTTLPNGQYIPLNKYAPMGSALCFPVLALCIWALLTADASDADARDSILVFGDDVIVRRDQTLNAIELLESFGFKVNRDKSCINGFFRESCGVDAYQGINVTPVRIKTVWSSLRRPDVYDSWIAYANSFYNKQYFAVYDYIVGELLSVYGEIPARDMWDYKHPPVPALAEVPRENRPKTIRFNPDLQRLEYLVWNIRPTKVKREIDGWSMLLRYFAEGVGRPVDVNRRPRSLDDDSSADANVILGLDREVCSKSFRVREYTKRDSSVLEKCWR